jgi:hypothetical protein
MVMGRAATLTPSILHPGRPDSNPESAPRHPEGSHAQLRQSLDARRAACPDVAKPGVLSARPKVGSIHRDRPVSVVAHGVGARSRLQDVSVFEFLIRTRGAHDWPGRGERRANVFTPAAGTVHPLTVGLGVGGYR